MPTHLRSTRTFISPNSCWCSCIRSRCSICIFDSMYRVTWFTRRGAGSKGAQCLSLTGAGRARRRLPPRGRALGEPHGPSPPPPPSRLDRRAWRARFRPAFGHRLSGQSPKCPTSTAGTGVAQSATRPHSSRSMLDPEDSSGYNAREKDLNGAVGGDERHKLSVSVGHLLEEMRCARAAPPPSPRRHADVRAVERTLTRASHSSRRSQSSPWGVWSSASPAASARSVRAARHTALRRLSTGLCAALKGRSPRLRPPRVPGLATDAVRLCFLACVLFTAVLSTVLRRRAPTLAMSYGWDRAEVLALFSFAIFFLFVRGCASTGALPTRGRSSSLGRFHAALSPQTHVFVAMEALYEVWGSAHSHGGHNRDHSHHDHAADAAAGGLPLAAAQAPLSDSSLRTALFLAGLATAAVRTGVILAFRAATVGLQQRNTACLAARAGARMAPMPARCGGRVEEDPGARTSAPRAAPHRACVQRTARPLPTLLDCTPLT